MAPQEVDPRIEEVLKTGYPEVATMLTRDAPAHNRYRALVNPAFSDKHVKALKPQMEKIVDELIAALGDSED